MDTELAQYLKWRRTLKIREYRSAKLVVIRADARQQALHYGNLLRKYGVLK